MRVINAIVNGGMSQFRKTSLGRMLSLHQQNLKLCLPNCQH